MKKSIFEQSSMKDINTAVQVLTYKGSGHTPIFSNDKKWS